MKDLVDSHCHFSSIALKGLDIREEIESFFQKGGAYLLEAAVDEKDWHQRLSFKKINHERILLGSGLHPSALTDFTYQWPIVCSQAESRECSAIGETGLDFFRDYVPREQQIDSFRKHIELSLSTKKPLIIHNREADKTLREIIRNSPKDLRGIMHCFSSDWELASFMLDHDFMISFAGNLTYKKSETIREVCKKVPLDRILIETDAPYLSPQVFRSKTNRPLFAAETLKLVAQLKSIEMESAASRIKRNFEIFFRL